MTMPLTFQERIYAVVRRIPKGKVLTYGDVTRMAHMKNPRTIGMYLHKNPDPATIPCHRVVNVDGFVSAQYAFGGAKAQRAKLESEGVIFIKDAVDLSTCRWDGM